MLGVSNASSHVALLRSLRSRANRAKGRRLELDIIKRLRKAGLAAARTDETTGFTRGVDILVRSASGKCYPVAIQCKFTQDPRDLLRGLESARRGSPRAHLWACIQKHQWTTDRHPQPRTAVVLASAPDSVYTDLSLADLIELIRRKVASL